VQTALRTLHSALFTLQTVVCSPCSLHSALWSALCSLHSAVSQPCEPCAYSLVNLVISVAFCTAVFQVCTLHLHSLQFAVCSLHSLRTLSLLCIVSALCSLRLHPKLYSTLSRHCYNLGLTTITNLLKTPRLSFWKDFATVALWLRGWLQTN